MKIEKFNCLDTLIAILILPSILFSQSTHMEGIVKDAETNEPLIGATASFVGTTYGGSTDENGKFIVRNVPHGTYTLRVSMIGYESLDSVIILNKKDSLSMTFYLVHEEIEVGEVVITGTRTLRHIADVPVRIEAIPEEEIEEKLLMTPSSTTMLLNEATGARIQTTSSTSGAANLRIQGLQGRYTQILVDGIPNFSGLSSGFGLTQLTPLNLRQVEIVKGAGSALFGPDAISGVINFITKEPKDRPEFTALLNGTTQKGVDVAAYYSNRTEPFGYTFFLSKNVQPRFDVDGDSFADVPEYDKLNFSSKLIHRINEDIRLTTSLGILDEERLGGTIDAPQSALQSGIPYLESITTQRLDGSTHLSWKINESKEMAFKVSGMRLKRDAIYGNSSFNATQTIFYSEAQYVFNLNAHRLLTGFVFQLEDFKDRTPSILSSRDYRFTSPAIFVQDEYTLSENWSTLGSGRVDFHNDYGTFFTPRASLMYRPTSMATIRVGGGMGFKAPTIFVEESEEQGFRNLRPLINATAEKSRSASLDVNWRTIIGNVSATFNTAFYFTWLDNALLVDDDSLANNVLLFRNASGQMFSRGSEFTAKFSYDDFKLMANYTYTFATQDDNGRTYEMQYNPRHSFGAMLVWESKKAGSKIGFESYWTGEQRLERNPFRNVSPSYWLIGVIGEKEFGAFRVFVNFENIFDTRQTRFEPIIIGNPRNGAVQTIPVYAPLEGRVINGGIRYVVK